LKRRSRRPVCVGGACVAPCASTSRALGFRTTREHRESRLATTPHHGCPAVVWSVDRCGAAGRNADLPASVSHQSNHPIIHPLPSPDPAGLEIGRAPPPRSRAERGLLTRRAAAVYRSRATPGLSRAAARRVRPGGRRSTPPRDDRPAGCVGWTKEASGETPEAARETRALPRDHAGRRGRSSGHSLHRCPPFRERRATTQESERPSPSVLKRDFRRVSFVDSTGPFRCPGSGCNPPRGPEDTRT
jgi:hypothetical protein